MSVREPWFDQPNGLRHIGPAEEWYCRCPALGLRPTTVHQCLTCGALAPWLSPDATTVERTAAMPHEGMVAPFDAGWYAHEIGLDRDTVRVLAADPAWALMGYDCRASLVSNSQREPETGE